MTSFDLLNQKVTQLYTTKVDGRDDWADWLYEYHVPAVAKYAKILATKYGANIELSQAAALLHDIADYKMKRNNPNHQAESLGIARQLMADNGYASEEIELVVEDALRFHGCRNDERPKSKEGLVLATADSLAHLKTDFYLYFAWAKGKNATLQELKETVLKKIDRDLHDKISFEDERSDAQQDYDLIKDLFSR